MARQMNAINQAMLYLEIIRRIPRHRFISTIEIQNSLRASGIEVPILTLQRYLKQLYDSGNLPIERDEREKPYCYRMGTDTSPFPFTSLSAQEALMLRLIEANLHYQLPGKLNKAMEPFFEAARQTLSETQGRVTRENQWLNKVAVVSNTLPQIPPNVKPRIFEAVRVKKRPRPFPRWDSFSRISGFILSAVLTVIATSVTLLYTVSPMPNS